MKRPITGRSMDFQGKAPRSPDKFNFLDPFQCTPRDKEMGSCTETRCNDTCEQSYNRPVWKSALLFPDIPVTNSSTSNQRSLNVLNASPPSATNEDDSSKDKGLLFKELSFLYEKWSDEDGKEPPRHDAVKIREENGPDCGSSSSNSLHSELIYEENSYYFHASSSPPESSENSMAMSFNHLSLTPSCDRLLLQSAEPAEQGISSRNTSSQSMTMTPCQSMSSPSVVPINRYCVFCKKNGETQEFYVSHVIKDSKGHVICPILRDYICPACGATGSSAHTLSYCPLVKRKGGRIHSIYNKPFNGTVVDEKNPWF